ncbi:hypothetical protein ACFQ9H_19490 [Streptomyces sp. NPDC056517]|uniref:hypothetical protein n=1 Tax=Streptomyces sp. NPDC056517 TaxID=3345848 RepID=UPI00368017D0
MARVRTRDGQQRGEPRALHALRLWWFRRSCRVQGVDLRTVGQSLVVAVKRGGVWHDVIVEPWTIREDDGSIGHSVTAGGIRAILGGGRV